MACFVSGCSLGDSRFMKSVTNRKEETGQRITESAGALPLSSWRHEFGHFSAVWKPFLAQDEPHLQHWELSVIRNAAGVMNVFIHCEILGLQVSTFKRDRPAGVPQPYCCAKKKKKKTHDPCKWATVTHPPHQQIDTVFFFHPSSCAVQVEQVRLVDRFSNKSTNGTLYLTATHLIFVESNSNNSASAGQEIWVSRFADHRVLPGSHVTWFCHQKCTVFSVNVYFLISNCCFCKCSIPHRKHAW